MATQLENRRLYQQICELLGVERLHNQWLSIVVYEDKVNQSAELQVLPHCVSISDGVLGFNFFTRNMPSSPTSVYYDNTTSAWKLCNETSSLNQHINCDGTILT